HATLSVLREGARAAEDASALLLDEGEADVPGQRLGQFLAVQLVELRLGVEQVELAGGAFEVDADAAFGLRREVRRPWGQRVDRLVGDEQAVLLQERGDGEQTDAAGAGGQEVASRLQEARVQRVHGHSPCGGSRDRLPLAMTSVTSNHTEEPS